MSRPVPQGRNDDIQRRAREGESLEQIAAAHKLTRRRVRQILEAGALARNSDGALARAAYHKARDEQIRRLLAEGKSACEVGRIVGVTEGTVRYVVHKDGTAAPKAQVGTQYVDHGMTPGETLAYLDRVCDLEVAPKWMQIAAKRQLQGARR